ncbi:hypothetical protein LXD69_01380 [Flavobacterium sediminilitoris]|uniref:Bacteriocin-type signal sequence-containing protein n=1 Tax=Flavobacterium sediminilitoris TaxID=2024526 RepID=A0ABY4HNM8_9FLAO|nr:MULTISPECIES: hypothetical protein [Flavobacterium]UOX34178.1 hypothetical protein LXD69_01380 [Flavobacterium sediminilitoris]
MLKKILNQKGTKELSRMDKKSVKGGGHPTLCADYVIYCQNLRTYDPCEPITDTNFPC